MAAFSPFDSSFEDFINQPLSQQIKLVESLSKEDGSIKEDILYQHLRKVLITADAVEKEALYSRNEIFEDVPTSNLKYLFLNYYLGILNLRGNSTDPKIRQQHLNDARNAFNSYIKMCDEMMIVPEKLHESIRNEDSLTAQQKREKKIMEYKKERDMIQRIQALEAKINKINGGGDDVTTDDIEEEVRDLQLAKLQYYAHNAQKEINSIEEELELVKIRILEEEFRIATMNGSGQPLSDVDPSLAALLSPAGEPPRSGLTITKLNKVNGRIVMTREEVHSTVFGDRIAPPTMTLEEYADRQMQDAYQREAAQREHEGQAVKSYETLETEGLEDDDHLVDQATMKARDWDAFKEANPKGWGNKMGKRF